MHSGKKSRKDGKRRKSKNTSRESSAGRGNCTELGAQEGGSIAAFKQADIGISLANNVTAQDNESTVYTNHKKHCYNDHYTHIHCILLSARSIVRKVDELKLLVHDENSDIIFITESWTAEHIGEAEINIPGYDLIRKDRMNKRGGGCLIYAKGRAKSQLLTWQMLKIQNLPGVL